ncbi:MAG: hypothetical protein AB1816_15510 [Bacillota bacterium]
MVALLMLYALGATVALAVLAARLLRALFSGGASAQGFLGVDEIRHGLVRLRDGSWTLVAEVPSAVNYALLSGPEQDRLEAAFGALMNSLNFPVQLYTQSRSLDLSERVAALEGVVRGLDGSLREYGEALLGHMASWQGWRGAMVRRNYVVLSVPPMSAEEAHQELSRRLEIVAQGLRRVGRLEPQPLSTSELAELLHVALNKPSPGRVPFGRMVRLGFRSLFVGGKKSYEEAVSAAEAEVSGRAA